jgi:hypothetical protein
MPPSVYLIGTPQFVEPEDGTSIVQNGKQKKQEEYS